MPTHRVVTMDELTAYLHLPEKAVAKHLGICLTSLKKLCRQHGITRWPYRKLKSLDKKIAKAENGTGTGTEDAQALKAKAEELKKEKMAVAFTYGLKDKGDTDSVLSDMDGASSTSTEPRSSASKPKKKTVPKAVPKASAPSSKSQGGSSSTWPFRRLSDDTSIPTPPEEHLADQDDLFSKDVDHEIGPRDSHLLDENGMHPTGWHGDADHLDVITPKNVVDVKLEPSALSSLEKAKDGTVTMTLVLPSIPALAGQPCVKADVSDADLKIATALASSVTPGKAPCHASAEKSKDEDVEEPAHQPSFGLEEAQTDHPFHSELMDSEFFAALPKHGVAHEEEEHAVCIDDTCRTADELSPSSASSNSTGSEVHVPEMCDLPPDHTITLTGDCWGEEASAWFSPDSPDKRPSGESSALRTLPGDECKGHQEASSSGACTSTETTTKAGVEGGLSLDTTHLGPSPPSSGGSNSKSGGLELASLLVISPSSSVH